MDKINHNEPELLLKKLCLNEDFADVIFIVEQERVPAHRNILAASSEYFRALFYGNFAESENEEFELDANPEVFKFLLKYIYTGSCDLSNYKIDFVIELLKVADEYGYTNLVTKIGENLNSRLNCQNLEIIMNISHLYNLQNVYNEAMNRIEYYPDFIIRETLILFSKEVLFDIIGRDNFSVNELDIFKAVMKWGETQTVEDRRFVLSNIRFTLMQIGELRDVVAPTGVLEPEEIEQVIEDIKTVKSLPFRKGKTHRNQLDCYKIENKTKYGFKCYGCINLCVLQEEKWANHLSFKAATVHTSGYYLEISRDKREWTRVADFSKYTPHGEQSLYFDACMVRYIYIGIPFNNGHTAYELELRVDIDDYTFPPMIVNGVPALTYFNQSIKEDFQKVIQGYGMISFWFNQPRYINCMATTCPFISSEVAILNTSIDGKKFKQIKYHSAVDGTLFFFFNAHIVQYVEIYSENYSNNSFIFFFNENSHQLDLS